MQESTKDKVSGAVHEAKGAIKQAVGHTLGNPRLETEGIIEKAAGTIQQKVGDIEKVIEK